MDITDNTILITGGGIGRELAEVFHVRGNRVIIAGRRLERLNEVTHEHPGIRGIALDVRDAAAVDALARQLREEEPDLNVLINNAGISRQQLLTPGSTDLSVTRDIVETDIMSVVTTTAAFLPQFAAQKQATVITTTSGLAFVPRANFPGYSTVRARHFSTRGCSYAARRSKYSNLFRPMCRRRLQVTPIVHRSPPMGSSRLPSKSINRIGPPRPLPTTEVAATCDCVLNANAGMGGCPSPALRVISLYSRH